MNIARLIVDRTSGDVVAAHGEMTVREALVLLAEKRIGALPVMDGGKVAGIFSERDVIYCIASADAGALDKRVAEVMTAPAITVSPATQVDDALALMTRRRIRHLPVVDGETMCGFISIGDLVKSRMDEVEADVAAMRDYITAA